MQRSLFGVFLASILWCSQVYPQGIDVFGYFQGVGIYSQDKIRDAGSKSMNVQQLNLFFNKDLGSGFNAFVNLEATNNYSTQNMWGAFSMEEAWLKYTASEQVNVQAGLLVPTFNNLNEIKNKTPLLPYVFRPFVYETIISNQFNVEPWIPERANIQFYGSAKLQDVLINYSAFVGNAEKSYITSVQKANSLGAGSDTSGFLSVGGRIGATLGKVRLGLSGSLDREKNTSLLAYCSAMDALMPGILTKVSDYPRYRLGVDFGTSFQNFTVEAEYIGVSYQLSGAQKADIAKYGDDIRMGPVVIPSAFGHELNKTFYYGSLAYDLPYNLYVYGYYSYLEDKMLKALSDGLEAVSFGGGYRAADNVVLKLQWVNFKTKNKNAVISQQSDTNSLLLAVSVVY
jgi:hypothetical protein